jgi:protein TonB
MESGMKPILGISMALHAAVFSTALGIGSQRGMLHLPATEQTVLEMHLGVAPHVPLAAKSAAPKVQKNVQAAATPPVEIAPPKLDLQTAEIAPKLPFDDVAEAGQSCNCAPVQSASVSATARSSNAGSPHGAGDAVQAAVANHADELPWIISSPAPEYPREARRKGWIGHVRVHVLISDRGDVQQIEIISSSGHIELDEAALAALRKWTFHPAWKDDHVIAAWVVVPVQFRLD